LVVLFCFTEVLKLPERFGGTDTGDDAAYFLLDVHNKNTRGIASSWMEMNLHFDHTSNMIYQNTITEFDFRQYLFARQCKLLFALNRPEVVKERAVSKTDEDCVVVLSLFWLLFVVFFLFFLLFFFFF
jgi:hypothetical protein